MTGGRTIVARMHGYNGSVFVDMEVPAELRSVGYVGHLPSHPELAPSPKRGWEFRKVLGPGPMWHASEIER